MKHTAAKMLIAFLISFGFSVKALNPGQSSFVKLKTSETIEVKVNGKSRIGNGMTIPMSIDKETQPYTIYSDNEMTITAEYKLVMYRSGRSESKNGSLKLHVHYKVRYGNAKRSTHVEHVFINADGKSFNEKVNFNIANGMNNIKIQLLYQGTLSN
ncbi:MAG: hypothetical protein ACOVP1_13175 [Bacteroidia bacterium]